MLRNFQKIIDDGREAGQFRDCDSVVYLLYVLGSIVFFRLGHATFARLFERDDAEFSSVFQEQVPEHALNALLLDPKP